VEIRSPLEDSRWDETVASQASDAFFNTAAWARVLHEAYGCKPFYFVEGGENGVTFLLPLMELRSWLTGRRGVSLPFSDYCEFPASSPERFERGVRDVLAFGRGRGWRYWELRNGVCLSEEIPASLRYVRHTLDLTEGQAALFGRLKGSVRTALRKAAKEGVTVTLSSREDSVRDFFRLNCETRRRHGVPPQPFRFFASIHRHILSEGLGFVAIASHRGRAVAAAMFFHFGKCALFKFGASDRRWQHLRGSDAAMWEAIRWYADHGYARLSMGRTSLGNEGLRRFKKGWGAAEAGLKYVKYDLAREAFVAGEVERGERYRRVVSMLPMAAARVAGALLCRHAA
jgi:hypothetical protein